MLSHSRSAVWPERIWKVLVARARSLLVFCPMLAACQPNHHESTNVSQSRAETALPSRAISSDAVAAFCGNCHATPPASSFAREEWPDEVKQGYDLFYASKRTDLNPPPLQRVVDYYRQRAPEKIVFSIPERKTSPTVLLERESLPLLNTGGSPGVSYIAVLEAPHGTPPQVLFCDMALGGVHSLSPIPGALKQQRIANVSNPCHITSCDLDQDYKQDFLVADLGSFRPTDHDQGRVLWLRSLDAGQEPLVLDSGLGRVADVRPGDFDKDGDQDVVVAEFGWRDTGRLLILENQGLVDGRPRMQRHVIDKRHGAIHVIPTDLNADGRLDFVGLLAQEFESVEAFISTEQGGFTFERKIIHAAGDPAFGSSGIELVDLDADDDLDVLFTNGDAFDTDLPKPYHAVHWLENRGDYPFTHHQLTTMPGVHRAVPGDLDGDGDLDIVATAHLPGKPSQLHPGVRFDSIIWLEQTEKGKFVSHLIETDRCYHAAATLGDLDQDGDLDIVVGEFPTNESPTAWLSVWWNQKRSSEN